MASNYGGRGMTLRIMQLALAFFFLVLGIQEVVGSQQSDLVRGLNQLFNRGADPRIDLVIGIVAIVSGLLLLLGVFQMAKPRMVQLFSLIIMIFWAIRFVYIRFTVQISMGQGSLTFYPNLEGWLLAASQDLIVLCALWLILQGYSRD